MSAAMDKAREKFVADQRKLFGEETIDNTGVIRPYEVISTGCLSLDYAMSVGGYVEGRITEIYGVDGIGKTTLALQGVREAQRKHPDKLVGYIDMERKLDLSWAQVHGVNISPESLLVYKPANAEDVADMLKNAVESGLFSLMVVDSIGAMIPETEKQKDAGEVTVAALPKIVTRMVKIATAMAEQSGVVVLLINQVRANLAYGADLTVGGGWALRYSSTHKLKLSRTGTQPLKVKIEGDDVPVGHEVAVLVERNKVGLERKRATFVLFTTDTERYGPAGIDKADDAAALGLKTGVIVQNAGWYTFPNGDKANGRGAVVDTLRGDPALVEQIRSMALNSISGEVHEETKDETKYQIMETA